AHVAHHDLATVAHQLHGLDTVRPDVQADDRFVRPKTKTKHKRTPSLPYRGGTNPSRFLLQRDFSPAALALHPAIEQRLLELPAVSQFEGRDFVFGQVLVKRVRAHAQILGRLPNVHHFRRIGHNLLPFHLPERNLPKPSSSSPIPAP